VARFTRVAKVSEIPAGGGKTLEIGEKKVALFNVNGEIQPIADTWLHWKGPLDEGTLEGNIVTCPWRHWRYDVTTGINAMNPNLKVAKFAVKVEGEDILVEV